MSAGVYLINLGNGWRYYGSSKNLAKRQIAHRYELRAGCHGNPKMQAIWNKYEVFKFVILERCLPHERLKREQTYLDTHFTDPKCANICPIAGSPSGVSPSVEARRRMSEAWKASPKSIAHLANVSKNNRGKSLTTAHRQAMSDGLKKSPSAAAHRAKIHAAKKGIPRSDSTKAKISAAKRGKPQSDAQRQNTSKAITAWWAERKRKVA